MKKKKVFIMFVIVVLIVCYCNNIFATATPSSYTECKNAKKVMVTSEIVGALTVIAFVMVIILFRKDKIKKITFSISIMAICIQIVVCFIVYFIAKEIYDENFQEYRNHYLQRGYYIDKLDF